MDLPGEPHEPTVLSIATEEISLSRKDLYEAVWGAPLLVLAKRWGVSDVAIGKACRRLKIPLPGRGYWAKANVGLQKARPALPASPPGGPKHVSFRGQVTREVAVGNHSPRTPRTLPPSILASLPESQRKPHPYISAARKIGQSAKETDGRLGLWRAPVDLQVSRQSFERALGLLDALFFVLEAQGMKVIWEEADNRRGTYVLVDGEKLKIRMLERRRQVDTPVNATEQWRPKYFLEPTGVLRFEIEYWATSKTAWEDRRGIRLENLLGQVPAALKACAVEEKRRIAERVAQKAQWEEEARQRHEHQLRLQAERKRRLVLLRQARNAERARLIRNLCSEASASEDPAAKEWIEWAMSQADALDPLIGHPLPWIIVKR